LLDYSCACCQNRHVVAVRLTTSRDMMVLANRLS
jgi:hypothetical protein